MSIIIYLPFPFEAISLMIAFATLVVLIVK
ncbi:putative holin-like toxin [uncultured Veillonella sp.]